MQSFRTELENPLVEKDIIDLARKIELFKEGKIHEDKFRSLRLARGVYGQRQKGVQMVRIKLPYGKMTLQQWKRIADISDEYSTGNLHLTTRQDIQIHYVSLDKTPELWAKLEQDDITLREACGNTVRNVTASVTAGIDPKELFDVTPYADAVFRYFLRNPICQDLGRKIKIAFSSSEEDTALTFMHDLGFIPVVKAKTPLPTGEGLGVGFRGFRVVIGGGLGAQPMLAHLYSEFLPEDQLIPTIEAVLRVFDRHGERNSRNKARLKFLIQKIGFEEFKELVEEEKMALPFTNYERAANRLRITNEKHQINTSHTSHISLSGNPHHTSNLYPQKQTGYYGIFVRIPNGNISSTSSRSLIEKLDGLIGEVRITINQGLLLRDIEAQNVEKVQAILNEHGMGKSGANSLANITSCPGTDTCNLAISDSTHISLVLEDVIEREFPDLLNDNHIQIKISGCMNSCGQHGMATIGFHGSSLKTKDKRVLPAVQILLGGGVLGNGAGRIADKVVKVPTKKAPVALRAILNDYENEGQEGEYFNDYYDRVGEKYFYELLKPIADLSNLENSDFIDWGAEQHFETEIGVGECAGVMIDLVATMLFEADEKLTWGKESLSESRFADAIYHAYAAQISAAKALLLDKSVNCSTQQGVITKFDENYAEEFGGNFKEQIMQINQNEPSAVFAEKYLAEANSFVEKAKAFRTI